MRGTRSNAKKGRNAVERQGKCPAPSSGHYLLTKLDDYRREEMIMKIDTDIKETVGNTPN